MKNQTSGYGETLFKINMFGEFSISAGDISIKDTSMRTHQLWHLLEFLITNRHRTIAQDELIDVLWPDADIENPANALKNLVYRIRSTFTRLHLPYARDIIVYSMGSYHWNNGLPCEVDSERFEEIIKELGRTTLAEEKKIELYLKALELYVGDFLPLARFEKWVVPISGYYRSLYFKAVYAVLQLLEKRGRYADMEMVCKRAIMIDQMEEGVHRYLMLSMMKQGQHSQALAHYNHITEMFYRELGVTLSASVRELHQEIVKVVHSVQSDLAVVTRDLQESAQPQGAYYCEYEMFKNLYRVEARTAARSGQSVFLCLLTIADVDGEQLEIKKQAAAMDLLSEIIHSNLRKGDVYSRFSATQFVVMLPTLTFENCEMVLQRIIKKFQLKNRVRSVEVYQKVQPLNPVEMGFSDASKHA